MHRFYLNGPSGGYLNDGTNTEIDLFDDSDSKNVGGSDVSSFPIIEISVSHSSVINAVSMTWTNLIDCQVASNMHGGAEGEESIWRLPKGENLEGISGTWCLTQDHGTCVTSIQFVGSEGTKSEVYGSKDHAKDAKFNYSAPKGFRIGAFFGLSGSFLSAIGVAYTNVSLVNQKS